MPVDVTVRSVGAGLADTFPAASLGEPGSRTWPGSETGAQQVEVRLDNGQLRSRWEVVRDFLLIATGALFSLAVGLSLRA